MMSEHRLDAARREARLYLGLKAGESGDAEHAIAEAISNGFVTGAGIAKYVRIVLQVYRWGKR